MHVTMYSCVVDQETCPDFFARVQANNIHSTEAPAAPLVRYPIRYAVPEGREYRRRNRELPYLRWKQAAHQWLAR
jgi:hypothetical protein